MSSGGWNSRNDQFSFRPYSGNNSGKWSSKGSSCSPRSDRTYSGRYPHIDQRGNSRLDDRHDHYQSPGHPASQLKAKDDEANAYAINLQLDPVNMGITGKNHQWEKKFQGTGAFSHYFGLCAPTNGLGYTLSDVWDGYFHITLAKFYSHLSHEQLQEAFKRFNPSLDDLPYIPDIVFRSSTIETHPGTDRGSKLSGIDFVVLPIEVSDTIRSFYGKVEPLLAKIKEQANITDWYATPIDRFHVTIRKYSNFPQADLKKIKIQQFPLEFRCSHLEIRQPRQKATDIYKQAKTYIWWSGVTEENRRCTGCKAPVMSEHWEGFCLACGKYEIMIPLWSTTGKEN